MMRTAIIAALLLAMLRPASAAAAAWQWQHRLPTGGVLTLDLVRAEVRAVTTADGPAAVEIAYADAAPVAFMATEQANGTLVVDRYPSGPGMQPECLPPATSRGLFASRHQPLQVVVRVPRHVRLVVRLMAGGIDARELRGDGHSLVVNHGNVERSRSVGLRASVDHLVMSGALIEP